MTVYKNKNLVKLTLENNSEFLLKFDQSHARNLGLQHGQSDKTQENNTFGV